VRLVRFLGPTLGTYLCETQSIKYTEVKSEQVRKYLLGRRTNKSAAGCPSHVIGFSSGNICRDCWYSERGQTQRRDHPGLGCIRNGYSCDKRSLCDGKHENSRKGPDCLSSVIRDGIRRSGSSKSESIVKNRGRKVEDGSANNRVSGKIQTEYGSC
jgi:hypothetical protein